MKVVFRVDASGIIGTGHHVRCTTLAGALRARGAEVHFVCRAHPGNLVALLRQQGLPVTVLPAAAACDAAPDAGYAGWVGASEDEDARQTIAVLGGEQPDWLVVDHYGLGIGWEQRLRPHVGSLLAIDDLGHRRHDCDLLLDQNHAGEPDLRYEGLVPAACRRLLGPRHALLRPEFAQRRNAPVRSGKLRRVLVFFGGSDPADLTGTALAALTGPEWNHLELDLVVGANYGHRPRLEQQAARRGRARVMGPLPHLADVIAAADLAIGAAGTTTWERMCLGVPSIVVCVAENQRPSAAALAAANLVFYAGAAREVRSADLARWVAEALRDPARLGEMALRNRLLVDGLGTARVAEAMDPTPVEALALRPARAEDAAAYFAWVNDPAVRSSAVQCASIPWQGHCDWFAGKLRDPASELLVLQASGLAVGQIRFDRQGSLARIDYSLDGLVRGRGWGRRLVALGIEHMRARGVARFLAEVKPRNSASCAVFTGLGFREAAGAPGGELRSFHLDADASEALGEALG